MTEDDTPVDSDNVLGDQSRRSVLQKGALAAGGLALGGAATGTGSAQQGGDPFEINDSETARMFLTTVQPGATFTVVSGAIDYTPGPTDGAFFRDYQTYIGKYQNRGVRFQFYPTQDADIQEGQVYRIDPESVSLAQSPQVGDDPAQQPDFLNSLVTVQLVPVGPPAGPSPDQNDFLFDGDTVNVRPTGEVVQSGQVVYDAQIVDNQTGSPGFDDARITQSGQVLDQNGEVVGVLDLGPGANEISPGVDQVNP
jgi:hypothetical protein